MVIPRSARTLSLLLSIAIIVLFAQVQSALAAGGAVWTGQYFNNQFLSGSPTLVRVDGDVAFNWGNGSPASGINADNFSVRWATDVYFDAGTYRFSVVADDSVYLRVDYPSQPQINTFSSAAVGQNVSVDITLAAGTHHIQLDYAEYTGDANVFLTWVNVGAQSPAPVATSPFPVVSGGSGPWTAQYFGNIDFYGSPVLTVAEPSPSHNWGTGSPAANIPVDNFSARWISFPTLAAGTYRIDVKADDGIRLYIDGVLSINEWHASTGLAYSVTVNLIAGQHTFELDYYESGGLAQLEYSMTPLSNVVAPPPPSVVNPPAAATTGTVNTGQRLNVRSEPNASAPILAKIRRGTAYPITGRNADSSWWQINVDGTVGWVYWRYIDIANPSVVPVVSGTTGPSLSQPPVTGIVVTPFTNVNMRSGPATNTAIIGRVPQRTPVSVVGRNAANTWWQVNDGRTTGWISAQYAPLPAGTSIDSIPVTG
jgi:uncharacterized protein YraI